MGLLEEHLCASGADGKISDSRGWGFSERSTRPPRFSVKGEQEDDAAFPKSERVSGTKNGEQFFGIDAREDCGFYFLTLVDELLIEPLQACRPVKGA